MSRLFLAFAIVFGLSFVSMGVVGCGDSAAVNKPAPKDAGPAPKEDASAEDEMKVDD